MAVGQWLLGVAVEQDEMASDHIGIERDFQNEVPNADHRQGDSFLRDLEPRDQAVLDAAVDEEVKRCRHRFDL